MSPGPPAPYEFDASLPLTTAPPGTNILVTGDAIDDARNLALSLVTAGNARGEGMLVVSTLVDGETMLANCGAMCDDLDRSRLAVVDCIGGEDEQRRFSSRVAAITTPGDLTRIGIETSALYDVFDQQEVGRVRVGILSVSTLLMYADLQAVTRFVNSVTSRVVAMDDLGVFVINPETRDERAVEAIDHLCDARIDVRRSGDEEEPELRVQGLETGPVDWTPFELEA
jgi:hypothetical protein